MITGASYTLQLGQKIRPGLMCAGQFTESGTQVAVVTTADTILLHSLVPREEPSSLKMPLIVTSIASVRYPGQSTDHLIICTKLSVLVYNVHDNRDVFRKDVVDGGNVALYTEIDTPMILVGGNCSVQGYSLEGEEVYWIVTGDNVRSLAAVDMDKDGKEEVIVGSEDYDLRIFKGDDLIKEITETHVVTHLYNIGQGLFAYALGNGTVGVYERNQRLWRVKSKHRATHLTLYDVNDDGIAELVTGWQGGKVDGRNVRTGEVIFKDNVKDTVAGVAVMPDKNHLIVVSITGEVRGYHSATPKMFGARAPKLTVEQDAIRELLARKQNLLLELKNYQGNVQYKTDGPPDGSVGAIPARTRLQTALDVNPGGSDDVAHVAISMATNNNTCIRAVIVFAEGIFQGETQVRHPRIRDASPTLSVALFPPRDIPIDIHIKAMVGYPDSPQLHVFELTRQLPRFSMYALMEGREPQCQSVVSFEVQERVQRVVLWLNRNFILNLDTTTELNLPLICLRDGRDVLIKMDTTGQMSIRTDNMALAGDLIQSLAHYLNLTKLQSLADFPVEERRCEHLLNSLQQLDVVKRKLNMELGSKSNLIRNLIIRGEDARLLGDYQLMKRFYQELQEVNKELQVGHEIRSKNYADTVSTIRELNTIVQQGSRLRVGKSKTDPVMLARQAIADNNPTTLVQAIRTGEA